MHGVPHTFDSPRDCAQFRTLPHRPGVELYRAHIVHDAFAPHTHDAYGFGAMLGSHACSCPCRVV